MKRLMIGVILLLVFFVNLFAFEKGKEFKDYKLIITGFLSPTMLFGNIFDEERDSWELSVMYSDGTVKTGRPSPSMVGWGINLEYLIGNLGITAGYRGINIEEFVSVGGDEYEKVSYSGTLISGGEINSGVNFHFPSGNSAKGIFDVALGLKPGYIWGTLFPYPSLFDYLHKEHGVSISPNEYSLYGYSLSIPIGLNFIQGVFLIGISFSYTFYHLFLSESLKDVYKNIDNFVMFHSISIGFNVGLAF